MLYFMMVCVLRKVITKVYREGMSNSLIEADDTQIKKKQWSGSSAKDLYILFFTKSW